MKKINSMKRRKNGLKRPRSPSNGFAVLCYPAPYRKLERPCRYCGSIIKIETHYLRRFTNGSFLILDPINRFCSSTCFDLCYSTAEGRGLFYRLQEAKIPAKQATFPQTIVTEVPVAVAISWRKSRRSLNDEDPEDES